MRLLLDTHVLLWAVAEPDRLPPAVVDHVADRANDVLVSTATAWEVAITTSLGRLEFVDVTRDLLQRFGFRAHAIDLRHTTEVARLPWHHRDPFDRLLVAQARVDGLTLVTGDAQMGAYDVTTLW